VYLQIHVHTRVHTQAHPYIHTYIRIYMHACIHTYIHTYRNTDIHKSSSDCLWLNDDTCSVTTVNEYMFMYSNLAPTRWSIQEINKKCFKLAYIFCFCFICTEMFLLCNYCKSRMDNLFLREMSKVLPNVSSVCGTSCRNTHKQHCLSY